MTKLFTILLLPALITFSACQSKSKKSSPPPVATQPPPPPAPPVEQPTVPSEPTAPSPQPGKPPVVVTKPGTPPVVIKPAPQPGKLPTPIQRRYLAGLWAGVCGYTKGVAACDITQSFPVGYNGKMCPEGFTLTHVAARYQGPSDNSGQDENWVASCIYTPSVNDPSLERPEDYSVQGGWYGLCVYRYDSSTCNLKTVSPMNQNKTGPAGFTWQHTAARYSGSNEYWVGTCVALRTGSKALASPSGSFRGLCAYPYNQTTCSVTSNQIVTRGSCSAGSHWAPFAARFNGLNEVWTGTCLND